MKKTVALLLVLVMVLSLFTACTSKTTDTTTNNDASQSTETTGDSTADTTENTSSDAEQTGATRDTVAVALSGNPTTFDSMMTNNGIDQMICLAIMAPLLDFDTDGTVVANVAKDWTVSEDGLTYTFELRDDVKFSNGDSVTAEDVVFSVERAIGSSYLAADWGTYVEGAEATGDYEVVIHMKDVYAPFLALCAKMLFIHDKAYYESYIAEGHTDEEYQMNLIGCGPYKFVSYEEGVCVYTDANEYYFKGEPSVKHLNFKIVADTNALSVAVQNGDINLIGIFTNVPNNQIEILQADPNVTVQQSDPTKVYFMPINTEVEGYSNPLVRQAISYAIDYDYINQVAANGLGSQPHCAMLGVNTFGYTENGTNYTYDKEKALALLEEAGYPNGEGLPVMTATIRESTKAVMEAVQSCLADIGITVEMNVMEAGVYLSEVRKGNFTTSCVGYLVNVDAAINDYYFDADSIGTMDLARWVNPEVEDLLQKAATTIDTDARQAYYDEAYGIIKDECPYIPLWYDPQIFVYTTGLNIGDVYPTVSLIRYDSLSWEN